ncbi:MAG: hypothetical protein IT289_06615 [Oligoflexia bacterium]|nr:hypothetical protein [Oligoflexia bacterium]
MFIKAIIVDAMFYSVEALADAIELPAELGTYEDPDYDTFGLETSCPKAMKQRSQCNRK